MRHNLMIRKHPRAVLSSAFSPHSLLIMLHRRRRQKRRLRKSRRIHNNVNPNRDVPSSEAEAVISVEGLAIRAAGVRRVNAGGRVEARSKIARRTRGIRLKHLLRVNPNKPAGRRRQINRVLRDRDAHVQRVDGVPVQDVSTEAVASESHKTSVQSQLAVEVTRQ